MHKIVITNEEQSFQIFLKLLQDEKILPEVHHLRCKKGPVRYTKGNRFKKAELQYIPFEGQYTVNFQDQKIKILIERGQCVLTTECRQIDYLKSITISGNTLQLVKKFVEFLYNKLQPQRTDEETIVIYENNGGYWNTTKQKKPRKLQSVIFKQQFINSIIQDIKEYIDSQQWYLQMGIPYKRSYLLFGPPGTGKSSLAQALAAHIKFSICFVNCSDRINDFQFNSLLNTAPKKSFILIQDVDSIFSERTNKQKNNSLTFSGFLNAIDGVRSQEGRIIVMTTNYKQRLDPALLRPGRVDQMYQIKLSSHYQIERLCYRFFKSQQLAKEFAYKLPQYKFSMSMIQGFLLKYRKAPQKILQHINDLLQSDENIKIQQYLREINCQQVINNFKIEQCYSLSHARSLPKDVLQKMIHNLSPLLKGRFLQTIRIDRKTYIKSHQQLNDFIEQNYKDEELQRNLKLFLQQNVNKVRTLFQIRDKAKQLSVK